MFGILPEIMAAIDWAAIESFLSGLLLALWLSANHVAVNARSVIIPVDAGNACHSQVKVANHSIPVLLDSGATGMPLVFGSNMIDALAVDRDSVSFDHTYSSANGEGSEAVVTLPEVEFAGWRMHDVEAVITKAAQDEALFGAVLLHKLQFTATERACILTMPEEAARIAAE
jgi:clan AA aspartic protease (TIGR02281 family)